MKNILTIARPNIQIFNMIVIMKGGEAYRLTPYRQKICSDVSPLRFNESKVGGAR